MTDKSPNEMQKKLINELDGICISDAGPGTGKTLTISLRYADILQSRDLTPEDVLLITFTNNAAENMKERIIKNCDYDKASLRDAPISTFHSLCNGILRNHGFEAPRLIGIDDRITHSTKVIENEVLEKREFRNYIKTFIKNHPEHKNFYRIIYDFDNLLDLIRSLASKGIFPTKEGWFRNSEDYLDGDFEEFKKLFDEKNQQEGNKQSELRRKLNDYKNGCFLSKAPDTSDVRGDKSVPDAVAKICFKEERNELKQFVHDLYLGYIEHALSRNYLNFSLIMMFAYVLLCEDHSLRKKLSKEYVMIDEFQDTNEIQFKLALLLSKSGNICVVGDWKQSIFGFQYASVDNILRFKKRIKKYKKELNKDYTRIDYPVEEIKEIPLKENYRSTQKIIDFSEQALYIEATKKEKLDKKEIKSRITPLRSVNNFGPSEIRAYIGDNQKKTILRKIEEIVDNLEYHIQNGDIERPIRYSDIAVLVRKRKFGLKLLKVAEKYGLPAAYEGGVELFLTRPSIILLAWLRLLKNNKSKRGWSVILDHAGYSLEEIEHIFEKGEYPANMSVFLDELRKKDEIGAIAETVFDKYGIKNGFSDKITEILQSTFNSSYMNLGDMIDFIEENIENRQTYEVETEGGEDRFIIQTIHAAKGLEYPVIILPDVTAGGGKSKVIDYVEPLGLRQSKIYAERDFPYTYDNWKTYILKKCIGSDYDEERRLLYVAMTRAENYLFLTAEKENESEFFNNLEITAEGMEAELEKLDIEPSMLKRLTINHPTRHAPIKMAATSLTDIIETNEQGEGKEFGTEVHRFAENYVKGEKRSPKNIDEKNVLKFIDSLDGELISEKKCLFPIDLDGRKVLIEGFVDLIHIEDKKVKIIDLKTDRSRENEKEYTKQLSIYYHVVKHAYCDKEIETFLFYTAENCMIELNPLDIEEVKVLIERKINN